MGEIPYRGAGERAESASPPKQLSMLPQKARLRKARDFKEVFEKGRGVRDGRLFLKAATTKNEDLRIGVVVSKQVAARAVDRNRIRRLLAEALGGLMPSLKPGHDIVLVTLPGLELANLQDAKQKVLSVVKKTSLLKP